VHRPDGSRGDAGAHPHQEAAAPRWLFPAIASQGNDSMETRPYTAEDRQACLDILAENTPEFFVSGDRESLDEFLSNLPGPYFVVADRDSVIACGGWAVGSAGGKPLTGGVMALAGAVVQIGGDESSLVEQSRGRRFRPGPLRGTGAVRQCAIGTGAQPSGRGPARTCATGESRARACRWYLAGIGAGRCPE
jgi:hypothetical protein